MSSEGTTTITYGYDRNGNTSWRRNSRNSEEMRFTYDVFDQLQHVERGVTSGGPGTSLGRYDYDVDGRRIRVRGGDRGDVDYYYDGLSVLQEMRPGATPLDDPTELLAHYRYADRLLSLDRYVGSSGGIARQWYHHDTLGSVMALSAGVAESEAAGSMLASYRYDPYGAIREQTGDSVNRAGFTGHQQDRETGLIYMNARYYDPAVGRFLTADSYLGESGNPPSLQRYLYGFGNPGRYVDPTGHNGVEKQPQAPLQELRKDLQRVEHGLDGVIAAYDGMRPYLPSHMVRLNQQTAAGLGAVREVIRLVDGLLGLVQLGYDAGLAAAPVVPSTGYQRHQQAAQLRSEERLRDLYAIGEAGDAYLEGRSVRDVAADGVALYFYAKAKVQQYGHSLIVEGSADAAATAGGAGVQVALLAVPSGTAGRLTAGGRRAFSAFRSGLQTLTGRAGAAERVVAARGAMGVAVAQAERATVEASDGLAAVGQAVADSRAVASRVSQAPRAFEAPAPVNPWSMLDGFGPNVRPPPSHAFHAQHLRRRQWARDIDGIHAQVERLGRRALREARGDWRRSEEIFGRYLRAANKRLEEVGSVLRFEFDAAAVRGQGRVWPWIQEALETGGWTKAQPWPGSGRVEAALVDTSRRSAGAPEVADSIFHQVVRVYDITLNAKKPSVTTKYSEIFEIPEEHVGDIRLN